MLRIEDITSNIDSLFKQGVVDILTLVLDKGKDFMFHEILESINIIFGKLLVLVIYINLSSSRI